MDIGQRVALDRSALDHSLVCLSWDDFCGKRVEVPSGVDRS